MKIKYIILFTLTVWANIVCGQNLPTVTSGTVVFEKKVNAYALMKKYIRTGNENIPTPAIEAYMKDNPQFKLLKSTLYFQVDKTLFIPEISQNTNSSLFSSDPLLNQVNTIYTDLPKNLLVTQKQVFEEKYLLKNNIRKITWKITDETREIAGYTCRRANAIILDSIYVVAFYTPDISVSGGPESFSGLPGMILGIALPHNGVSWFATKVLSDIVPINKIVSPQEGVLIDDKSLKLKLQIALKDWGPWKNDFFLGFVL